MSTPMKESEVDVLIIGAGPAGVMACNALARNGIDVRIIDQRDQKVAAGHADGIQPRTLEIFQSYGLADTLLKQGAQMHTAAFYNPSPSGGIELTDRVPDVTAPTARYPFEVTLNQGNIETIFLNSLRDLNVEVNRPIVPTSIQINEEKVNDPTAHAVQVVLQHTDGAQESEIVNAKYVIGADGAHSWVRKSLDIALVGEQTNYIWGVIDFTPDTDFPDIRNRTAIHSNNGSCMIIPREGDKVRLYVQLDAKSGLVTSTGRVDKEKATPELLLEIARKTFHPYTIQTPELFEWWTIYIIGQRVASKFSVQDRVFIVGDACHTHSPKAGQGMNASMGDSHNLAWKLTQVIRGSAKKSLLQTYEFERKQYAEDLINFDKEFSSLFSGKPRTEENQDGVSHSEFLKIFQTFGGFTSGIGIHYADSVITQSRYQDVATNLIIGERLLPQVFIRAADIRPVEIQDLCPADGRFKIFIFTGNTSQPGSLEQVRLVAHDIEPLLLELASRNIFQLFDIVSIRSAKKADVRYNELPVLFRPHWSKALIDDTDNTEKKGGDGYRNYGIDETNGAIVIVRPDGYVGMVAPLDGISEISSYFSSFIETK
ncbi:FAD binding domain-containing protein [Pholiota molesta]|nr:FAD binding domain-containing protein [Pholiota molesta]